MSENQLVPIKRNLPMVLKKEETPSFLADVSYERVDSIHYSFSYDFDDSITFRMDESEQTLHNADCVDIEFDAGVEDSEKIYYSLAAASGILTGMLSVLHLSEDQLNAIDEFKEKDWKPIVVNAANLVGYKKSDYKGASKYLIKHAVKTFEKSGKTKEIFTVLAEHPSVAGLIFSLITQFSGKTIIVNENGSIRMSKLPEYYTFGETNAEKIVCAVLYWLYYLAVDEAVSKRRVLDEMGISQNLLKKIKEFAGLPFFKKIPSDSSETEIIFSQWLSETIIGAEMYAEDECADKRSNSIFAFMGIALNLAEDSFPVLINECIVHSLYILIRLCSEVKNHKVLTFEQLSDIPVSSLLPTDGRVLSKMCLIASATFAGTNIAAATLKAIKDKKTNGRKFSESFLSELNFAGIGRFLIAFSADSKYWGERISVRLRRNDKKNETEEDCYEGDDSAFESLYLDPVQAQLLYSLEFISVKYDIAHTKKLEVVEKKSAWLKKWREMLLEGLGIQLERADEFFIEDEESLYNGFFNLAKDKEHWRWFYLLTQELVLFTPYFALGLPDDKVFKKLQLDSDYLRDQFVRRQTIASQDEVDKIKKYYKKYSDYISGSKRNKIIGVGATAAVTVATGGFALSFAPGIAAAIAGEAVVGLHGAALTSASLAFVGGGSLAAGGLGVAGGTAIITGGGALLGLAGSGTASAVSVLLQTSSEYWVRQSAKLLTYCNCVLCENLKNTRSAEEICCQAEHSLEKTKRYLAQIQEEKTELDKELVKKTEEYLKYLKKCCDELNRINKKHNIPQ